MKIVPTTGIGVNPLLNPFIISYEHVHPVLVEYCYYHLKPSCDSCQTQNGASGASKAQHRQ